MELTEKQQWELEDMKGQLQRSAEREGNYQQVRDWIELIDRLTGIPVPYVVENQLN